MGAAFLMAFHRGEAWLLHSARSAGHRFALGIGNQYGEGACVPVAGILRVEPGEALAQRAHAARRSPSRSPASLHCSSLGLLADVRDPRAAPAAHSALGLSETPLEPKTFMVALWELRASL